MVCLVFYPAIVFKKVVMAIYKHIASLKAQSDNNANRVTVTWVGPDLVEHTYSLNQQILNRYDTAEEAKAALDAFTQNNFGYVLTDIWFHKNRDGLRWCIATGPTPPAVWPEDEPAT